MNERTAATGEPWGTDRAEALSAKGRYGRVSQSGTGSSPPYWYGEVIDVHSSGEYLLFKQRTRAKGRWYHRRDVKLHSADEGNDERD